MTKVSARGLVVGKTCTVHPRERKDVQAHGHYEPRALLQKDARST
jgi:hypothetical protein